MDVKRPTYPLTMASSGSEIELGIELDSTTELLISANGCWEAFSPESIGWIARHGPTSVEEEVPSGVTYY